MIFRLEIELGNAAMLTGEDVGGALRKVARRVEELGAGPEREFAAGEEGSIRDENGNTVGRWAVSAC